MRIVDRMPLRGLLTLAGVGIVTLAAHGFVPAPLPGTAAGMSGVVLIAGFAYLLVVLVIASTWGFVESLIASVAAALAFNFFFLPPVGTFTISEPHNWVALFTFLATSVIASRLSTKAEQRARDATERQQDLERLYTFSRAVLLIGEGEPFPKQLARKLVETFEVDAAVLYDRRSGEFYREGPADFDGLDDSLREAALHGVAFFDAQHKRVITSVRLGAEPIASLALQGVRMPDAVLQGIGNLVAIGLERARAQDMAHEIEAARQSEQLRTALIDAMAHEFKTPLTSIKAATTSLLASPEQTDANRKELLTIADEEADHLRQLIDNAVEMARLDSSHIEVHLLPSNMDEIVREVVASLRSEVRDHPLEVVSEGEIPEIALDRRLVRLAIKQLVDNALKYSPPRAPVTIRSRSVDGKVTVEVADRGKGIPEAEQARIFHRFYRSPSVKDQIPGSGLGLSIAHSIVRAHNGDLKVSSRPGETKFQVQLPVDQNGENS